MKKIAYSFILIAGLSLSSCGNAAENDNKAAADSAAMQATADSMMNAAMNSSTDTSLTVVPDTLTAPADSVK